MTYQQLTISALRDAQLILARYVEPGARDPEKAINDLLAVLDRDDVVEAVKRLEDGPGMRDNALTAGFPLV